MRLDYKGTPFSKDKGFAVIEFKYKTEFNIDHPFNTTARNSNLPYTNTGMTGAKHNIIPEYVNQERITFSDGDEMTIFDQNGKIIEKYEYLETEEKTSKIVKRWIKQ